MLNINTYAEFMAEAERLDPDGFAKARADRAEADALRKDAERYRWLRKAHDSTDGVTLWHVRGTGGQPIESGSLDADIDAAMRFNRPGNRPALAGPVDLAVSALVEEHTNA